MIEIQEDFKVRLQKALNARNMKPIELANRTGLSEATISQYRSGYSKPKQKRLALLADVLRVSPAWLMGLAVPMEPDEIQTRELSAEERELLSYFNILNRGGKEEALKRIKELSELERYRLTLYTMEEYNKWLEELVGAPVN